jgi:hypothetical protein
MRTITGVNVLFTWNINVLNKSFVNSRYDRAKGFRRKCVNSRVYTLHIIVLKVHDFFSPQITGSTVCLTIILVLMALNMLITSIVLSNGYISTCSQYVHRVKSFLMVNI